MIAIKNIKALFLLQFLLFYSIVNAQKVTEDSLQQTTYKDTKTFKAPSKDFVTIVLQTHNGLLRFGVQNNYTFLPDGRPLRKDLNQAKIINLKRSTLNEGRQAFTEILRMKFMTDLYKDLDKKSFTVSERSMYKEDKNSLLAQNQLLKLANAVSNISLMAKHFCNPKIADCNYNVENFYRGIRNTKPWGGGGANEFKRLNSYTSFVSQYLEQLQRWSSSLFTDNTIDGYLVLMARLGVYDFENKGYWLSYGMGSTSWQFLRFHTLAPNTINERKLTSSNTSSILYKMPVDTAEEFSEKTKIIYLVYKVKAVLEGLDPHYESIKTSFSLENSIIELYDNEDLKTKIGEIAIDETLTVK
jgi:hypothetical protein